MKPQKPTIHSNRHGRGFSLLEVLISLTILAGGLLGMAGLQIEALKFNQAAFTDSQAQFLISDMFERIRANKVSNTYVIDFIETAQAPSTNCTTSSCSSSDMAVWDISEWRSAIEDSSYLPSGESAISYDIINSIYTISIRYEWSQLGGVNVTNGKRTVSVTSRI